MTTDQYTALQDDGCPHCPDHVYAGGGYFVRLASGRTVRIETVLRLEGMPQHPPHPPPLPAPAPGYPPRQLRSACRRPRPSQEGDE